MAHFTFREVSGGVEKEQAAYGAPVHDHSSQGASADRTPSNRQEFLHTGDSVVVREIINKLGHPEPTEACFPRHKLRLRRLHKLLDESQVSLGVTADTPIEHGMRGEGVVGKVKANPGETTEQGLQKHPDFRHKIVRTIAVGASPVA